MKATPKNTRANSVAKDKNQMILEKWSPMIERTTGVKDPEKLAWMSQLAHNTAKELNESIPAIPGGAGVQTGALGGAYSPYATLYNTPGIGDVIPAGQPALTGADYASNASLGSGDKYPALLPLALKVAGKTVGFDLVNTMPLQGPSGVLPYLDYVYAGGRAPYGEAPGYDVDHQNPNFMADGKRNGHLIAGVPAAFKAAWAGEIADKIAARDENKLVSGMRYKVADLTIEFAGYSRIDGDLIFKVIEAAKTLGDVFAAGVIKFTAESADAALAELSLNAPRQVSMLEDQIQGFTGAGARDNDPWQGTYNDGTVLYEPMSRGTGERTAPRQLSLQLFTRHIQVGTITVGCSVTQEQVQDLQKQWGIDVVKMVENAGITELTNTINRHITSRLFGLGWKNHCKLVQVEGSSANLNLSFNADLKAGDKTPAFAIPQHNDMGAVDQYGAPYDDFGPAYVNVALPFKPLYINENAAFENRDTLLKRVATNIMLASNWIHQRGRYGAATFVVTNITVASALQSNAHFTFSPVDNNISQSSGQLYNIGTLAGLQVYVDPNMAATDCRVLVGRKGNKDEAGVFFCPYILAESVKLAAAEGTMAPKLQIKSRYALVNAGWYPETQYLTFFVDFAGLV